MPSNAVAVDVPAFLSALSFGADDLNDAKAAVRTSREARRTVEEAAREPMGTPSAEDGLRRALALYLLCRPEQAARVLPEGDGTPQITLLRGRIALEQGDPSGAVNAFASLVGSPLDGRTMLLDLATAAALAGDPAMSQKAASKLPDGPDALYAEGIALEADGEYKEARQKYEAALKVDPNHPRSLFRLALRLDVEGEDDQAI
ncbi:MAG: tetratricopeptide repeat protein, partial [Planctomycetota bacterium]